MSGNASPLTGVHAPFSQYYVVWTRMRGWEDVLVCAGWGRCVL